MPLLDLDHIQIAKLAITQVTISNVQYILLVQIMLRKRDANKLPVTNYVCFM